MKTDNSFHIAVLGGSRATAGTPDYETARAIGREIALRGGIVVSGGYGGVMEAASLGAAEKAGTSVGIVIANRGEPNRWLSRIEAVPDLAARLKRLREIARAWIVLPRGLGTLLEIAWIAESIVKTEASPRPLVFVGDFWAATVRALLDEATGQGRDLLAACVRNAASPERAVAEAFATQD